MKISQVVSNVIAKVNLATTHIANTINPHGVTKAQVGLGNVDNTSDANKPTSTATQTALNLKANQSTTYTKTDVDTIASGKLGATANAVSATKLVTARTIGGVSFDGTLNINLPGVNAAGNQSTTGNAATATTASNVSGGTLSGNLITNNYGIGLVGLYSATRYQNVFSMGDAYKLTADGTGVGTMYGIAWTHSNIGGESKAGLEHQALFMMNGVTKTAIGNGVWTSGTVYEGGTALNTRYLGISNKAADSNLLGGLGLHTGRNNEANKVVRTDASGYLQTGYINCSNGNENNNSNADRVWGTNGSDDYMRTYRTSALSVGHAVTATKINPLSGDGNYKLCYTADGQRTYPGEWGRAVMRYEPNGQTYGIRVDRADYADSAGSAQTAVTATTAATGTNTTQIATTAFVKTASESTSIGIGQSWTNVTSSRVAGTTYTNSTGKPIMVFISFGSNNITPTQLFVNNNMCVGDVTYTSDAYVATICVIIPNGSTYKVDYFQNVFLWSELR